MKRIALAVPLALLSVTLARAQSPADPLRFEVASVRASAPADPGNPATIVPIIQPLPDGSVRLGNLPLRLLIRLAYNVDDENVIGGPPWQTSARWDINARAAAGGPVTQEALQQRMRGLLEDRFKLKTHTEQREMSASALVLATPGKLGPDLKVSTADCSNAQEESLKLAQEAQKNPANALAIMQQAKCGVIPVPNVGTGGTVQLKIRALGQPMSIVTRLVQQMIGRPVVDKTGLTGNYDFEIEMPLDPEMLRRLAGQLGINVPPGGGNVPAYDGPALNDILNDRLGLKLDTQKSQVQVVVIDSAEMPAAD